MTPGPLALVGSGEYLPVMLQVERDLLAGRPARFVQLPTAAGAEGPASIDYWTRLGMEQAERLGVEAVPLPVLTRYDAEDPALAAQVQGAGLVYLSGGSPRYLAQTLHGSAVWKAIVQAWHDGAALAGCSAGAMAMAGQVPDLRRPGADPVPGLGVVPALQVIPHFDRFFVGQPERVTQLVAQAPAAVTVIGVDEDTALTGGPQVWRVQGRQSAWVLDGRHRTRYPAGTTLTIPTWP